MKLINKILIGAGMLATLSLTSCEGFLSTKSPSALDDANVFSNYDFAEFNIYSIYECLAHQNAHRGRYLPYYGFNTDIEVKMNDVVDDKDKIKTGDKQEMANYSFKTTNGQLNLDNGPYNELMVAVERANLCIQGLRTYGNVENNKDMAMLLGESLVARAFVYVELLKAWGEGPARFLPITPETMYVPKADRDVIYKQLLADLEESFNYLPWPGQHANTMKTTRPSLAFAKGLYARVALMAVGESLRPEEGKVNTGNAGTTRCSSDPMFTGEGKTELLGKVRTALEDVYNNAGLELYADYAQLWKDFNEYDTEAGKEIIYSIPFSDGRGRWNFHFAIKNDALTKWCPRENTGGDCGPAPSFYFKYDRNGKDQRRDVSCKSWTLTTEFGTDLYVPAGGDKWYFGKYRWDQMKNATLASNFNDDGAKPVYMRYSDILLMLAEVCNELDDLTNAKKYLLEVRKRAYKGYESEADAYVSAISDKNAMFNAIVDERAFEFVGEFLRKNDLIRWGMLKTKLDEYKAEMKKLQAREGIYGDCGPAVWYRYADDGYTLEFYGLNKGEIATETEGPSGYQICVDSKGAPKADYFSSIKDNFIEAVYVNDPNTRQYWPLFASTITNSQGSLVNDYGF